MKKRSFWQKGRGNLLCEAKEQKVAMWGQNWWLFHYTVPREESRKPGKHQAVSSDLQLLTGHFTAAEEPGRGLSHGQQASPKHVFGVEGSHSRPYPFVRPVCYSYSMVVHVQVVDSMFPAQPWLLPFSAGGAQDKDNGLRFELQERELLGTYDK